MNRDFGSFNEMGSDRSRYEICTLPRAPVGPPQWFKLREKLKEFRLNSLKVNPEAFASTYADEVKFDDDVWEKRLTNPLAISLCAIQAASDGSRTDNLSTLIENDWLGAMVVIGPKEDGTTGLHASRSPWETVTPDKSGYASAAKTLPVYQLNGVYVIPGARGLGIGKKLTAATIQAAVSSASSHGFKAIRMQVRVEAENSAAQKLYSSCGFAEVGRESYETKEKEKNGVKIPARTSVAVVMEQIRDVP